MQMSKVDMKNNVTKNTIVVAESMTLMIKIINEEKKETFGLYIRI